ncbi:MAG: glycosyltransferase [Saprospiraceae bacterium]|nr:glycosyltransferase [Saprospiraceae bacterium]
MKYGRLLIISHTEHHLRDGQPVGWGPTVREINHLLALFDEITHVAVLYPGQAPPSALPYASDKIRFVPLRPYGGPRVRDKLGIIRHMPETIRIVRQELRQAEVFQFRAPTGMGVYLIPWLQANARIPGWFKYAGNWMQPHAPLGYRIQKHWLTRSAKHKVTINGRWPGQPEHCLSFENPCLNEAEREAGAGAIARKTYQPPYTCCFVGRLEDAKGVGRILEALKHTEPGLIQAVHLVGDGPKRSAYEAAAKQLNIPVVFHGFLDRDQVSRVYTESHFILLPSDSEGFPKVLAEAMNYGCLPVSSNVSSIPHYIAHGENGFLWDVNGQDFTKLLNEVLNALTACDAGAMVQKARETSGGFTFAHYQRRIQQDILNPT